MAKKRKKKPVTPLKQPEPQASPEKPKKSFGRKLWGFVHSWAMVIIIVLAIRAFGVESMVVPTGSMENTILPGDFVLVNKFVYGFKAPFTNSDIIPGRPPRKGDVIVFRYPRHGRFPQPDRRYFRFFPKWFPLLPIHWDKWEKRFHWYAPENWVKRCVGVPGDTVEIINKQLYVNGKRFEHEDKAVHKDPHTFPMLVPREEFQERWMDLLCFMFADSLHYADSTIYQSHENFAKIGFEELRLYYDSLFNALYYSGRLDENFYLHYVTSFYMHPQHRDYLEQNRLPLQLPLPPEGTFDLKAFYNRLYSEWLHDTLPPIDSMGFASYITHLYMRDNFGPIVVPEGVVMGIGDNRDLSHDCRYWGFVPIEMLKGSPVTFYYSLGDEEDAYGRKRSIPERILATHWDRIGRLVE